MGKKGDLSNFEHGMVVGARRAGLSISKTADVLRFSSTTISSVYREWSEKEKISSERQLCARKCLLDVRGQRRMGRLVRDDRKATVTQITTRYNQDIQNTISERTTCWTLKADGLQQQKTTPGAWKHGSILPCLNGSGVGFIFLAHFGPLSTNWASFKHHSLPDYCCWPCPSLYDYSVPIFWWLLPAG